MRRLSLLLSVVALVACSGDSGNGFTLPPTDAEVVGTYSLTTSNGRTLPFVVRLTANEEWDLVSDQFVISANGTWMETTNYAITSLGSGAVSTQSSQSSGTYSIANKQINFVMTNGGTTPFTGAVNGNILSLLYNGAHFSYSR